MVLTLRVRDTPNDISSCPMTISSNFLPNSVLWLQRFGCDATPDLVKHLLFYYSKVLVGLVLRLAGFLCIYGVHFTPVSLSKSLNTTGRSK